MIEKTFVGGITCLSTTERELHENLLKDKPSICLFAKQITILPKTQVKELVYGLDFRFYNKMIHYSTLNSNIIMV